MNQRRSSGLADPIELVLRFGTPSALVEELKARMLEFVLDNKRDYLPRIISEVRTIDEVYSVTLNVIFFHKSNFQNELLRLQRHNKFAAELMNQMTILGIEGPRKAQPGGAKEFPFYYAPASNPPSYSEGVSAESGPFPGASQTTTRPRRDSNAGGGTSLREMPSHSSFAPTSPDMRRRRAESRARQYDRNMPDFGDVFEGRKDPAAVNLARLQALREEAVSTGSSMSSDRLAPLGRSGTMDSGSTRRRGLFSGRPRSATVNKEERASEGAERMV